MMAASLTAVLYFGYQLYYDAPSEMEYALVALEEILPRTQITEEMFATRKIGTATLPKGSIPNNVFRNKDDVIGKYTVTYYTVPKNGYLYQSYILPAEEMKDGTALLLKDGERMIAIDVNLRSSLAAQIVEGSYINLWLIAEDKEKKPIVGPFLNNVRVIGTFSTSRTTANPTSIEQSNNQVNKDKSAAMGQNIVPQTILLAVNDRQTTLATLAETLGKINVVGTKPPGGDNSVQVRGELDTYYIQNWLEEQLGFSFEEENINMTEAIENAAEQQVVTGEVGLDEGH
jgi:Flp pilus assembly protein CpaB